MGFSRFVVLSVIYYLLIKIRLTSANQDLTFFLSFENSKQATDSAEFKDPLPELSEFSICHWDKPKAFSDNLNSIWNYCFASNREDRIDCFQLWLNLVGSTANRHISIGFRITYRDDNDKRRFFGLKEDLSSQDVYSKRLQICHILLWVPLLLLD